MEGKISVTLSKVKYLNVYAEMQIYKNSNYIIRFGFK